MDAALFTKKIGDFTAKIFVDIDPFNPRKEYDQLSTFKVWSNKYSHLGDETCDKEVNTDDVYWLNLYVYDHSGLTINTTGFSCGWDSSHIGIATIDKKAFHAEFGDDATEERAEELIRAEVYEFDMYLRGEIYGYTIEDEDGIEVSSCWGMYGYEYTEKEVEDLLKHYVEKREKECGVQMELALA